MTELDVQIPHALATAHVELIAALDEGINQYKTNLRYSNVHDVCRCIERFVDALCQNPGGRDELRSRATQKAAQILRRMMKKLRRIRRSSLPQDRAPSRKKQK